MENPPKSVKKAQPKAKQTPQPEDKPEAQPPQLKPELNAKSLLAAKPNKWLSHVSEYRKSNPSVPYKDALKNAKATYTK